MSDLKKNLRAQSQAFLAGLPAQERVRLSRLAQQSLLASPEFASAQTVLIYHSDSSEVDTGLLAEEALRLGKTLAYPRVQPDAMSMRILRVTEVGLDLVPGFKKLLEPREGLSELRLERLDLVVVPGRAFDAQGNRLGRGAGYYDRFLAQPGLKALVVALAFEGQVVQSVPAQPHDRPVARIFTESRTIVVASTS